MFSNAEANRISSLLVQKGEREREREREDSLARQRVGKRRLILDEQFHEEFYNPEQEGEIADHASDSDGHPEVSEQAQACDYGDRADVSLRTKISS
jgi:hypothetical protein